MQVKLKVPKTKVKFWPPLQDIHCHGNHLSFGKALMLEKHKQKTYFEILWGGPHGANHNKHWKKPKNKNNKKKYLETLWGGPQEKSKNPWKKTNIGKTKAKMYSEALGLPPPSPRLLVFFFQCFLCSPMIFYFSNVFLVFSMGPSPKSLQILLFFVL
jgi:hypothetical protein